MYPIFCSHTSLLRRGLFHVPYELGNGERWKVSARSLERIDKKARGDTALPFPSSPVLPLFFIFRLPPPIFFRLPPLKEPLWRREFSHPNHCSRWLQTWLFTTWRSATAFIMGYSRKIHTPTAPPLPCDGWVDGNFHGRGSKVKGQRLWKSRQEGCFSLKIVSVQHLENPPT